MREKRGGTYRHVHVYMCIKSDVLMDRKGERQEQPCVETLAVSERGFHLGKDTRTHCEPCC